MTEAQTKVLNILEDQPDPLTSADIAGMSGMTQQEVLRTLGQLQQTHTIIKSHSGYKLEMPVTYLAEDYQTVLKYLAGDVKARMPKTIRTDLDWEDNRLKVVLRWGKSGGYLAYKDPGVYYITLKGVEVLKRCAPDFVVSPAVIHKIKNPPREFTILPEHQLQERKRQQEQQALRAAAQKAPVPEKPAAAEPPVSAVQSKQSSVSTDQATNSTIHPAVLQAHEFAERIKPVHRLPVLTEPEVKIQILLVLISTTSGEMQHQLTELQRFIEDVAHATA